VRGRRGREKGNFQRLRLPNNKGVSTVHEDHDIFVRSLERETKIKLTFISRKHDREKISLCAPLHFSKSPTGQGQQDCYFFWDFGAKKGSNFLSLSPSQMVRMELTDEVFYTQDFYCFSRSTEKPPKDPDIDE